MILSLEDVLELKKRVLASFATAIHFHDGCGGQYFTLDNPTSELKAYLVAYFDKRNAEVLFSPSGDRFRVEARL